MTIDASIVVWLFLAVLFVILLRQIWTIVVIAVGLLVAGVIFLFVADALSGGDAIVQLINAAIDQLVPLVIAALAALRAWIGGLNTTTRTSRYDV